MIKEIAGRAEFDEALRSGSPVLADFYASWCAPCKMQSPILYEFAEAAADKVRIIKIDVDANAETASEYGVDSIPTLALFVGGTERERRVGLTTRSELSDMLIKYL